MCCVCFVLIDDGDCVQFVVSGRSLFFYSVVPRSRSI